MKMSESYVYIMTNIHKNVLYTGVTANIIQRVEQHKNGEGGNFTSKYKTNVLVYVEVFDDIYNAILREKQIKAGSRADKVNLIESQNPDWRELSFEL